ncbi:ATP-binding protein [Moraxella haemolytica]|uniref:ATP-binding protein n=1 Tax=Moraxella haemolytica TaxID=2904119 RepID=UPI002543D13B|nr:ATP-binding protein [Moraxella sp. ZY171148]WII95404.1 ATP-binding protein [Moraxella sp. ZY171148]
MNKVRFGLKSAYGQLILLVFLPIAVLAMVGGYLVFSEVRRAVLSEQDILAQAALLRYETAARPRLERYGLTQAEAFFDEAFVNAVLPYNAHNHQKTTTLSDTLESLNQMRQQRVQRLAIMNDKGEPLHSFGMNADASWTSFDVSAPHVLRLKTSQGVAYGNPVSVNGKQFWLFVEMDNKPLTLTYYHVWLALSITGLMTILLLLLILNSYSKRWITPIYEMRLYLQRLDVTNLSNPTSVNVDGEFSLLQKDFLKALKRLDGSFNELKNHAEETERDLQQAFDEMEMQNISIRNARDAAVSTSQAKSAFLANISHELRTPLNSIDGFINLLARKQGLTSEQNLYVQTIKKSSAHLLALVNDVLDFSKIEAGKLVLEHHEFDLYATIYDVVDMLSPAGLEKHLRLAVLFYHDVPTKVVGDSLRVKQILTNLVGNAIKFTDAGGVVVRVGLSDVHDGYLNIAVEDTGKGISETDKAQLFKSFSQGDLSVTRRYGGTGLGLVISKQLTMMMGGDIGFFDNNSENIAPTGATFWFEMPTNIDIPDEMNGEMMASKPNMNANVLVWINHAPAVQVLKASLAGTGVVITEAIGLADLLEQLDDTHEFDWVIVDNFGQDAAQDDIGAILRQIRLRYDGRLMAYGYQVGMDAALLERYHANALYEPMDKRQLYELLSNQPNQLVAKPIRQQRFTGTRVLAVDDHLPNLLVLEALLGELGVEVVMAGSGFDAIEIMTKTATSQGLPIDLIFMDVQMPRMSGLEASIEIRKIEQAHLSKPVPIIALTAHGLSDEKDRLVAAGLNDYVGKPIGHQQLLQTLQRWLGHDDADKAVLLNQQSDDMPYQEMQLFDDKFVNKIDGMTHTTTPINTTPSATMELLDIDWQDALSRAANKAELAEKLLTMMIDNAEQEKQLLERAWADRDRKTLADLTHRMVGASRYTGVPRLRQAAQDFESRCRADITEVGASHFVSMRPSYRALIDALDDLGTVDLKGQLAKQVLDENKMNWKM